MNSEYLLTLDPSGIAAMNTAELRAAAIAADLPEYSRTESVATLPVSAAEIVGKPGTLTRVLDKAITALLGAYSAREPSVKASYRGTVEIKVWSTDDTVRENLRYQCERAHELVGSFNGSD